MPDVAVLLSSKTPLTLSGHLESVDTLELSYGTSHDWRYERHLAELKPAYVLSLGCSHGIQVWRYSWYLVKQALAFTGSQVDLSDRWELVQIASCWRFLMTTSSTEDEMLQK